jgi:PAS domain S-box-containing protein
MTFELRFSLLFLLLGTLWMMISDRLVGYLFQNTPEQMTLAQTVNGWAMIAVSAGVFYILLKREARIRSDAQQEIQQSATSFRYLFLNNPHPMWVYDRETLKFLEVNDTALREYGYTRDEFLSMTIKDIRAQEDKPRPLASIAVWNESGEFATAWQHRLKNGQLIDVEMVCHTLHFAGRDGVLVIAENVTARNRLERDLLEKEKIRLALTKEIELRDMRSRFMSMVSHEFRTPLASISVSAQMLDRYNERLTDDARHVHLEQIQSHVKSLMEMLEDILTIMKSETINPELLASPVDLVSLCRKAIEELRFTTLDSHELVFETDVPFAVLRGDEKLLRRAVSNLVSNAIKYSPGGGRVWIDLWREDAQFGLRVKDEGIGIPDDDLAHLFQAFHRADNVGNIPGTGLGLIITKQAIETHGGTLDVQSQVGVGTVFTVHLPLGK